MGIACSAVVGVYAVLGPPLASAAPAVPSGTYDVVYPELDMTATWVMTPCGPACTSATSQRDGHGTFVRDWAFRLNDGQWTFDGPGVFYQCDDGTDAPAHFAYRFDAVTLAGKGRATMSTDACGGKAGQTQSWTFTLTKTG